MLLRMKRPVHFALLCLAIAGMAGCPEKKPEGDGPATAKPMTSAAPANAPAAPANPPAKPAGGW
jgi:hypothetical protein